MSSRNNELRQANSFDGIDSEENAVMDDIRGNLRNSNVYYELSSSKNDMSESEAEDENQYACIGLTKDQYQNIEADEIERLREKL